MGGRSSRNKGKRVEYLVRDYFRSLGFGADRVPSSGAAQGFKGDVKVTVNGSTLLVEVKARQNEYKRIYAELDIGIPVVCEFPEYWVFASRDVVDLPLEVFRGMSQIESLYKNIRNPPRKLLSMQKLLGEAEILVIKDNNRPLFFLYYRRRNVKN